MKMIENSVSNQLIKTRIEQNDTLQDEAKISELTN